MFKYLQIVLVIILFNLSAKGQRLLSENEAVQLALGNARNINVASLTLRQQQQLLRGAADISDPQVTLERTPYEPLLAGVQQQFDWPTVYQSRKQLQKARIGLAESSLKLNELDVKRLVRTAYLDLQYLNERILQLRNQDSIYKEIKTAALRNFEAGQINKLDELFAASQADRVNNELQRAVANAHQQRRILQLITGSMELILTERLKALEVPFLIDSIVGNVKIQVAQQQVEVSRKELQLAKSEFLPSINAGLLFPLDKTYNNFLGYQIGVSIPIWRRQYRSRVDAANTGIELAQANQQNALLNLQNEGLVNQINVQKEQASLAYFNNIAIQQASEIIETSRRLFAAGQITYIESLRNITTAFETRISYLETLRNYNKAVIEFNYLTGNL